MYNLVCNKVIVIILIYLWINREYIQIYYCFREKVFFLVFLNKD